MNIKRLIRLTKEPSFTIPRGVRRKQLEYLCQQIAKGNPIYLAKLIRPNKSK